MTGERLYNLCYGALRLFHWSLFLVVVEIMFWYAGWIIFGLAANFLSWALPATREPGSLQAAVQFLPTMGKYLGLIAGIFFNGFIMGRYSKSPGA